jgi:hypothetical protein
MFMMNFKFLFVSAIALSIFSSCGPAGENKEAMYARAKVFQDSIGNVIKSSMDEAAAPADPTVANTSTGTVAQPTAGK